MDLSYLPHVGLLSEYQKEYLDYSGIGCTCVNRRVPAGLSLKGPTEGQPQDYDIGDGVVPDFRGESTSKSAHCPQPTLSKLPSYKPSAGSERPPMLLGPNMMEVDSVSRSAHGPQPLSLARTTAPRWIADHYRTPKYQTRYDLTSSYQADYCGVKTRPRSICLDTMAGGDNVRVRDQTHDEEAEHCEQNEKSVQGSLHDRLNDYVKSLLFRTTTGSTYQPPSVFGKGQCHPPRDRPDRQCPAEALDTVFCKIHRYQDYHKKP
ncbi:hypothetical protein AVEN_34690-1 [Araneus ventricosus]|uniref:Uncharacterized protein n=1 Tax=Araneus ventricosus TaxID=182803 RepID=A0A4Y2B0D4_ARAVE|nr:hypothetical protein AVEN_34690-1 [Araneus ventricosus]